MTFDGFAEAMHTAARDHKVIWAVNSDGALWGYAPLAEQWVHPLCAVALTKHSSVVPDPDELAGLLGLSYEDTERIEAALHGENEADLCAMLAGISLITVNRRSI